MSDEVIHARDPSGLGLRWPARLPLVIAAFVISVVVALALQRHEFTSPNWGLAVLVVMTVPWVFDDVLGLSLKGGGNLRVSNPYLVLWSAVVIGGVWALTSWLYVTNDFAPFLLVVLIAEMSAIAGARFGAVVLAICVGVLAYATFVSHRSGTLIWAFAFVIGWLGGLAYRSQTRIATELFEAQEQLAEQAKEEERRHLAREIHDLIAHSLAVSMLHLSGARLALAAGDTEDATAALADAEAAGRAAMAEIHRTVGLLGRGLDGTAPPTPCAGDLPELVDGFRRAGLDVRLRLDGDLDVVPLAPGLTAYRVVQESLSNAVKHAPGASVDLAVAVEEREVNIRAVNDVEAVVPELFPTAPAGNGLRGMAERVALLGGTVASGNGNGSWKVHAHIPWSEPT